MKQTPTILFVEDNAAWRDQIANFLRRKYQVYEAGNGDDAFKLLSSVHFDAVISDNRLHGRINGIGVLRRYDSMFPGRPKVLITGYTDEVANEVASLGIVVVEKPCNVDQMMARIEDVLSFPADGAAHITYRKNSSGVLWHFCMDCSLWPTQNFDELSSSAHPPSGTLCEECGGLQKSGRCQTSDEITP